MTEVNATLLNQLLENALITHEEYAFINKKIQTENCSEHEALVSVELINEDEILPIVSEKIGIPFIYLKKAEIDGKFLKQIPAKYAYHYSFIPVKTEGNNLFIAFSNPFDYEKVDEIQIVLQMPVKVILAGIKDIKEALKRFYGIGADTVQEMMDQEIEKPSYQSPEQEGQIEDLNDEASMIKFVNQVISEAVKERATDIHIEPYETELKIRYRIDGILYDAPFPTTIINFHHSIISRLKIMSNLNISERRLPQDGRFKIRVKNKELDLRLSILPTPWGEAASIRLLSGATDFLELKDLGLNDTNLKKIQTSIKKPHGMILVTGPTGSGKTTSLYAFLNRMNTRDQKIVTIEDPIEYLIPNLTQLQINPAIQFTFATGLRSMLRHDPDIMMVGEIRDYETAEISIQAALTGHLVLSTLHTNDAASTINRLIDIGVENYLLASSLQCIIAQRLIRNLCEECKEEETIPEEIRANLPDSDYLNTNINFIPKGCNKCNYTGFYGRSAQCGRFGCRR